MSRGAHLPSSTLLPALPPSPPHGKRSIPPAPTMSQTTERFELQTRIAVGNAGLVYRGVERATRRRVALKLLSGELPHPLDGAALLRDVARVRRTAGNNIAQLLEALDDEEGVVLVYEYADGASWAEAATERRLDAAQAVDVAAQLLSALAVGEAIKVPHGELKPANLVLGELPGGRLFVWVLDWGLAAYRAVPPPDALRWMPPEQLAGGGASAAGDLFAMGACLCWLLTGTVPVAGATREELLAAWKHFPADALRQVRPDLPPKFTRWVSSLMEANPKLRPTAAEARGTLVALQPPAPPVLPEIFRPRPKSPYSTVTAPRRSGIIPVPRAVAVPRVVAAPAPEDPPPEEPEPESAREEIAEPVPPAPAVVTARPRVPVHTPRAPAPPPPPAPLGLERKSHWPWIWAATLFLLAGLLAALPFLLRRLNAEPEPPPLAATAPVQAAPALQPTQALDGPLFAAPSAARAVPKPPGEPATGTVIAEERFDYAPGTTLHGQKGGPGWKGGWNAKGASGAVVRAASLTGGQMAAGGTGGHLAVFASEEVTLRRALGSRSAFCDEVKGGDWWFSIILAHSSAPGAAKGGELHCNFVTEAGINDIIRLTFTEKGSSLVLSSLPPSSSPSLPGPAEEPKRIVGRVTALPVGSGKFDVTMDLWANPDPAAFGGNNPHRTLTIASQKATLPAQFDVQFLKRKGAVPTTTLIDELRFGPTAKDVLD